MSGFICRNCQNSLRRSRHAQSLPTLFACASSTNIQPNTEKADSKHTRPSSNKPLLRKIYKEGYQPDVQIPFVLNQSPYVPPKKPLLRRIYKEGSQPDVRGSLIRNRPPYIPPQPREPDAIDGFLSTPTWSVRSLLPSSPPDPNLISDTQFDHLVRLSALQLPKENAETVREKMKQTLLSQLHFVQDIQKVDTEGVEPLVVVRNETRKGMKDITIGLKDLKEALEKEEITGRLQRPRRKREVVEEVKAEDWDCLATAFEVVKRGDEKYFVVYSGKEKPKEEDDVLRSIKIERRLTAEETAKIRKIEGLRKKEKKLEQEKREAESLSNTAEDPA